MAKISIETTRKFASVQVINVDVQLVARVMRMYDTAKAQYMKYKGALDELGSKLNGDDLLQMDAFELISDLGDAFLGKDDEEQEVSDEKLKYSNQIYFDIC